MHNSEKINEARAQLQAKREASRGQHQIRRVMRTLAEIKGEPYEWAAPVLHRPPELKRLPIYSITLEVK